MMDLTRRPWWPEIVILTIISIILAWIVNAVRPEPLPWYGDFAARKTQEAVKAGLATLTPQEAIAALGRGAYTVIDAREADEFAAGHVPGAVHVSAEALLTGLDAQAARFSKDQPLLFYCGGITCPKSKDLAEGFKQLGFTNLAVMPEGFEGWTAAGGAVEGGQ